MEYQRIINLLDITSNSIPRFITKKWVEVYDQSNKMYSTKKQIRFETSMLRSNLYNYSDAYIAVNGTITAEVANNRDRKQFFRI